MKTPAIFITALLLFSCVEPPRGDVRDMRSDQHEEVDEALKALNKLEEGTSNHELESIDPEINLDDIVGSVFDMGESHHLNGDCKMEFECDCCGSLIAFAENGVFFDHAICVADERMYAGEYKLENNTLTLTYSRFHSNRNYQGDNHELTTDTMQERIIINFKGVLCSSDFILKGTIDDGIFYLVNKYTENTEFLTENEEMIKLIWSPEKGVNMD